LNILAAGGWQPARHNRLLCDASLLMSLLLNATHLFCFVPMHGGRLENSEAKSKSEGGKENGVKGKELRRKKGKKKW
jgi:hypothetical protein